jgi:hypothetical protein
MNADYLATLGTAPPFLLISNELPNAELPDVFQILDHAHAILGSIPLIQMVQPGARKTVTIKAILDFSIHYPLTVLDPACQTGFHFETVITSASGAGLIISWICAAEATVHSAWSDKCRMNRFCLFRSSWCHVGNLQSLLCIPQF